MTASPGELSSARGAAFNGLYSLTHTAKYNRTPSRGAIPFPYVISLRQMLSKKNFYYDHSDFPLFKFSIGLGYRL